jgi:hypothetical protein
VTIGGFARRLATMFRTRAALGMRPLTAPVIVFIPLGVVLGTNVSGILSATALAHLDVVISIALATLGVFIGIAAGREARRTSRLFVASTVEAGITIAVVAAAALVLLQRWALPVDMPHLLIALALGVCASASAAPSVEVGDAQARHVATRVADLDDVMPILLGGLVLALAAGSNRPPLIAAGLTIGLGLAIGLCGWLLVERSEGAERGVFVLGALALLGGAPAYLGLSPLLAGMSAGLFWVVAPGECDVVVARELRKLQHPLIVLLLIISGAGLVLSTAGIWLFAPYVIFRFAGKVLGGWTAARLAPDVTSSDLGAYLISPGVIGVAFALNLHQVAGEAAGPVVFAVAIGAMACEALALVVMPDSRPA